MNVLYIGPYRQKNINGMNSLFILKNILSKSNYNISCRPLYIDDVDSIDIQDFQILKAEQTKLDTYDIIIQNVMPKDATCINHKKNICIPIMNEEIFDHQTLVRLNDFNVILTDNKISYNRISRFYKNKAQTYDYDLPLQQVLQQQFNIGVLGKTKKLYFIGNYTNNITNIQNLCLSFIMNVSIHDCSLVLFLLGMNAQTKNELDTFIHTTYNNLNLKYSINRIVVIPIDGSIDSILTSHQTGDMFIDLQDDNTNTTNAKIATAFNKPIISFLIEDYKTDITRNNKIYKECIGVSANAINTKIIQVINAKHYTTNQIPFKKEHISKIL